MRLIDADRINYQTVKINGKEIKFVTLDDIEGMETFDLQDYIKNALDSFNPSKPFFDYSKTNLDLKTILLAQLEKVNDIIEDDILYTLEKIPSGINGLFTFIFNYVDLLKINGEEFDIHGKFSNLNHQLYPVNYINTITVDVGEIRGIVTKLKDKFSVSFQIKDSLNLNNNYAQYDTIHVLLSTLNNKDLREKCKFLNNYLKWEGKEKKYAEDIEYISYYDDF